MIAFNCLQLKAMKLVVQISSLLELESKQLVK